MREFDALIGDVPDHAKYIIDKYTKDSCCIMCGHPAQPSVVVNELKHFLLSNHLSSWKAEIKRGEDQELDTPHGSIFGFFGSSAYDGDVRKLMNNAEDGTDVRDLVMAYNLALDSFLQPYYEAIEWAKGEILSGNK